MRIRLIAIVIAAGSVIVLAGCGNRTAPAPAEPSATQAASPIPQVIKNPRDVAAMARRPCELLTSQQAVDFRLDLPPEQLSGLVGTLRCHWESNTRDRQTIRTVDVSMFTNNPTLEVAYNQDRGRPFFEQTEIAGYPALVSRTNADLPICDIDVKPAQRQSVSITYESQEFKNNPQQSCDVGKKVAAAVVMNLPPKS